MPVDRKILFTSLERVIQLIPIVLQKWDIGTQRTKLYEETGELITAIAQYRQGRVTIEHVLEECADVIICVLQMSAWHANVNSGWLRMLGEMIDKKRKKLEIKVLASDNGTETN